MAEVWEAMFELKRTPKHNSALEAAEEYKDCFAGETRVVSVESGIHEGCYLIERAFSDGGGGWVEIGIEGDHDGDYVEVMKKTTDEMDANTRLVFDFTNDRFILEAWSEPE